MRTRGFYWIIAFFAVLVLGGIIFQSCERNPCNGLYCLHGGSCGNGLCTCPVGWDGPTCEIRTVDRFLGTFAGSTVCDANAPIIDSVFVLPDTFVSPLTVKVVLHTSRYDTLVGTVSYNATQAVIMLPPITVSKFFETFTLTLEYGNQLTVNTYSDDKSNPNQEVQNKCNFVGTLVGN